MASVVGEETTVTTVSMSTPFNRSATTASAQDLRPSPPPAPSLLETTRQLLRCPPHGLLARLLFVFLVLGLFLGTAWGLFAEYQLWTTLYSLTFLLIVSHCFGWIASKVKMPPLLGMLISGFCLKNIPGINQVFLLDPLWSSRLRTLALVVILLRAGIGLDPAALKRLSFTVVRLAFAPCLVETLVIVLVTHFFLDLPVVWGFVLGFVLAAVSPAVVVPSMIWCQEERLGLVKGIPTLVIAAASIDDVLAITGFSVALGIAFDSGANLAFTIIRGPLEVIIGVGYGFVVGVVAWFVPHQDGSDLFSSSFAASRFLLLFLLGVFAAFVFENLEFPGAGALGALTAAFVANLNWRRNGWTDDDKNPVNLILSFIWQKLAQPLLFGLIGAEIRVAELEANTVGIGIACLAISLAFRMVASVVAVLGSGLNNKEMLFIPLAWLPKATVQAAIGATAYDLAKEKLGANADCGRPVVESLMNSTASLNATSSPALGGASLECLNLERGLQVLTLAVLAILITAPIGAVLIALSAPKLLERAPSKVEVKEGTISEEVGVEPTNFAAGKVEEDGF